MTEKRRVAPRYSVDIVVRLRGALWSELTEFRAKDVSRGGLFIRTEAEPEIFSEVELGIELPWGDDLTLRARIVHIMGVDKARGAGIEPGLGLEFRDPAPVAKAQIERFVAWARDFQRLNDAYATLPGAALPGASSPAQYDEHLKREQPSTPDAPPVSVRGASPSPPMAAARAASPRVMSEPASDAAPPSVRRPVRVADAAPPSAPVAPRTSPLVEPKSSGAGTHAVPSREAPGTDLVRSYLTRAVTAYERGDYPGADQALSLLHALDWDRPELRPIYDQVDRRVATALADNYEKQARQEEKQERWKNAARSWLRVCRGRPNEPRCHTSAAAALVQAGGNLRQARDLAQRAVQLAPGDAGARRVLGEIYLKAGHQLNARRELDLAAKLSAK